MRLVPAGLRNTNAAGQTTAISFKMIGSEIMEDNENNLEDASCLSLFTFSLRVLFSL